MSDKEKNLWDLTVDELVERQRWVKDELHKRFAHTRTFRTEPMKKEDLLYQYNQITPDMEMALRQSFGDDIYDEYKIKMEGLRNG